MYFRQFRQAVSIVTIQEVQRLQYMEAQLEQECRHSRGSMLCVNIFVKHFRVISLVIAQRKFLICWKKRLKNWHLLRMLKNWQEQQWKAQD